MSVQIVHFNFQWFKCTVICSLIYIYLLEKVTKDTVKTWLQDVYFLSVCENPSECNQSHLVIDALTQYYDFINICEMISAGVKFELKRILADATDRV